jgi:hypothetical protein
VSEAKKHNEMGDQGIQKVGKKINNQTQGQSYKKKKMRPTIKF